jgi:hypothetical protein
MIGETKFTVEDFRKRIEKLTDAELLRFGRAAPHSAEEKYVGTS